MKTLHIALATIVAILLQPLPGLITFLVIFPGEFPPFEVLVFYPAAVLLFSGLAILLFGIPCFDALHKTQKLNFFSLNGCATVLAMLPYMIIARPRNVHGYTTNIQWHEHVSMLYDHGHPMTPAWLEYAAIALWFGVHGFLCGLVFYVFWRRYKI
ncbi:hypothetical protein [Janthinobacterium sp. GW458P]|uniref:hypothetical protein n=1 Tax=Janthinobacterium sp. GW458P TaxID=1981504 RepID=UPI00112139B9|nr:hypothetical protein [Janthinobacterium sp. GW458P]MBE3024411.1 hypothetical protein [Janthinobacterium sp. GW458P]